MLLSDHFKVMKYKIQSRDLIIAGLFVTVILLFFFRGCGGNKDEQMKAIVAENKLLRDKVATDSITRAAERIAEKDQLAEAHEETAKAKADVKAADRTLSATQTRIKQLVAMIKTGGPFVERVELIPEDSACKELAAQVSVLNNDIDRYRTEVDETMELLNYEVLLRDSIIEKETDYSAKLKADFNRQSALLENALTIGRPRGKFLAGAGVIGNQTTFLSGAKVMAAYQTKGGKQYQGGAILMGGTVWYEAGVMVQLFK
jgi:hypothetical protein